MKFDWEEIYRKDKGVLDIHTARVKVFGGWIVNNLTLDEVESNQSESMVFVPDPNHEWVIDGD